MSQRPAQREISAPSAWEQLSNAQQRRIRQDLQRMLDHPESFEWRHNAVSDKWQAIPPAYVVAPAEGRS